MPKREITMSDEIWGAIIGVLGMALGTFFVWLQKSNTKISNLELKTDNLQKELEKKDVPCKEHTKEMTDLIREIGQLGNDVRTINNNLTSYQKSIDKLIQNYESLEKKVDLHEYMINELRSKHSINYKEV